jgi:hypothetical protein
MASKIKKMSLLAVAVVAGVGFSSARADSVVNLDTTGGGASLSGNNWVVSGGGPNSNKFSDTTAVAVSAASLPGSWVTATTVNGDQNKSEGTSSHNAVWVSTDDSAGVNNGDVDGTTYVFSDTFTMPAPASPPKSGYLIITGTYSLDNWVTGQAEVSLDYTVGGKTYSDPITYTSETGDEFTYRYAYNLSGGSLKSVALPEDFTLNIGVTNSYADGTSGDGKNPGPVGLILAGTASIQQADVAAVPLPASAGVGFSMLAGLGLLAGVRRKLFARPRIA